jgi:hypothetical protein
MKTNNRVSNAVHFRASPQPRVDASISTIAIPKYPSQNQRLACCDNRIAQKTSIQSKPFYASAKAKASAITSAPHATNHSAPRLDPSDCEESLAEVAIPDPESVGMKIKPDDSEPVCWRMIVLACRTSPAAMG